MKQLQREETTPNFVPGFMATSLMDVDFKLLQEMGIKYIAFDADSTLVHYGGKALDDKTKKFLQQNRQLFKKWCIASNRITNDLLPLGESMDAQVVRATWFTRKPHKRYFAWVLKHFGAKPQEIAMIGDKLMTDIVGANRAGMTTVWVERIGPDHILDRVLHIRALEKLLMKRYRDE